MKVIVYCGANTGFDPFYKEVAQAVGTGIAQAGHDMVYGGGGTGLMGAVADACLEAGGEVHGVLPHFMATRELAHDHLTELEYVDTMAQRKARMLTLGDACLALPGGVGTLEEISEAISWLRVGQSDLPCAFYNARNYYEPLAVFFQKMVQEGFLSPEDYDALCFSDDLARILAYFEHFKPNEEKSYEHLN